MKQIIKAGFLLMACLAFTAGAQDWYHDRDARFRGEEWRGRIFYHVRVDLDHVGSAIWASGKERRRLDRTKEELAELQGKLEHGYYDEHELDDVIDSLKKSANDDRLASRDREVIFDDMNRLKDYRAHHEHWGH